MHSSAEYNRTVIIMNQLLLKMPLSAINQKNDKGYTALDLLYQENRAVDMEKQKMITTLRKHGGRANWHKRCCTEIHPCGWNINYVKVGAYEMLMCVVCSRSQSRSRDRLGDGAK